MIQYGDGSSASGECGTDTLVIGGLSIENQVIETASKLSAEFSEGTGDGLLGLAWSKINSVVDHGTADPQSTPVENMIKQHDIPKESELFTSAFYSDRDEKKDSFFTFGYIDQDLLKSLGEDIHWTKVDNSNGFWSVPSESVSINGEKKPLEGNTAIMDTGTTLALLSDDVVDALYAKIKGATYDDSNQGYVIPSNVSLEDLPEVKIDIGGKEFLIQKEDLIFAPVEGGSWYGGVQSRGTLSFDILGDAFLKSIYAVSQPPYVMKLKISPEYSLPNEDRRRHGLTNMLISCLGRYGIRAIRALALSRRLKRPRISSCLMSREVRARRFSVILWSSSNSLLLV